MLLSHLLTVTAVGKVYFQEDFVISNSKLVYCLCLVRKFCNTILGILSVCISSTMAKNKLTGFFHESPGIKIISCLIYLLNINKFNHEI